MDMDILNLLCLDILPFKFNQQNSESKARDCCIASTVTIFAAQFLQTALPCGCDPSFSRAADDAPCFLRQAQRIKNFKWF
jgi:hypothetical protein